jgi:hypothetical protein
MHKPIWVKRFFISSSVLLHRATQTSASAVGSDLFRSLSYGQFYVLRLALKPKWRVLCTTQTRWLRALSFETNLRSECSLYVADKGHYRTFVIVIQYLSCSAGRNDTKSESFERKTQRVISVIKQYIASCWSIRNHKSVVTSNIPKCNQLSKYK